ncbi:fatty-acyl-CoA synthase [Sinobacterium caligoides]|uniref:Fatty-acyl-CoA synthase n=1 Tax=Sinobacterium caligoides TaxID=933926 RepID=A0A3N2DZ39_9GAMM|nr:long-chain fatty acid--CoA ligase [Sinobacterium caligoides]ROS05123.1 fatty-acyl-CoA synthase [Sinobacterium caligoides]
MLGNMMEEPLLISAILEQAQENYPQAKVYSRVDGGIVEHSYEQLDQRSRCLAAYLQSSGVVAGERVASLAWNNHRHLELYYAVSGVGAVMHTINPRLYRDQVRYIFNHGEAEWLFIEPDFLPLLQEIEAELPWLRHIVVLAPNLAAEQAADSRYVAYEQLLASSEPLIPWPSFDENSAACLCYTSGTTGDPKGVLYSHRSTVLHAMASVAPNALNISADSVVMPVVPMYHVCAWGVPYSALLAGATLALPGSGMAGEALYELIEHTQATLLLGVPTVWLGLLQYLEGSGATIDSVETIGVGGAAAPPMLIKALERHGIYLMPIWGMTETSPLVSYGSSTKVLQAMPAEERQTLQATAGRGGFGVRLGLFGDDDRPLPRDGKTRGNLRVKGHWVLSNYFRQPGSALIDGWFDTGDVATLDAAGYLRIVDRKKDVIKSGGEWISSIDLENAALDHPQVLEACVIGARHLKWDERPLLLVVLKEGGKLDKAAITALMADKLAKWWLPDDIVAVESLPHTATGKLLKRDLRTRYRDYLLSEDITDEA